MKKWGIPILIIIPTIIFIVSMVLSVDNTILVWKEIQVGTTIHRILVWNLWDRTGNGYINNIGLACSNFINSIKNLWKLEDLPNQTLNELGVLKLIYNLIAIITNMLIISPITITVGLLNIILAICGINFNNASTIWHFLHILQTIQNVKLPIFP